MTKAIIFTALFVVSLVGILFGMRYELAGDDENTMWVDLGLIALTIADIVFLVLAINAWGELL